MSEHTKEPWFFSEWSDELVPIRTKSGRIVCDVGYADTDQINIFNARRIVACVNACAGIPTGMLIAAGQSAVIALRPIDEVIAERDELLAAAELVLAWYEAEEDHSKEPDFYKRVDMCRESEIAIRAAIAKVKQP